MPELPEVEVIRRGLEPLLKGKIFGRPELAFPGSLRYPTPQLFIESLPGREVCGMGRKGKFLLIFLNRGELVVHLRMTGRLIYQEAGCPPGDHLRIVTPFTDGSLLYFSDIRKFGGLWLLEREEERNVTGLHRLGPDFLEELDAESFASALRSRPRAKIKTLLLDQSFAAGLGNIYVDESLHRSAIHPLREAASLSSSEVDALYKTVKLVLAEGIRWGGTSSRDYRDALGNEGGFQKRLLVYGRKGERCPCGQIITRITAAGRGTHFCPGCQRVDKSNK